MVTAGYAVQDIRYPGLGSERFLNLVTQSTSLRGDFQSDSTLVEQNPRGIAQINGDGIDFLVPIQTGGIDFLLCLFQRIWTTRENGDMSTY